MMDYGYGGYSGFPMGLSMALMMNEQAKEGFENLSETEKEHLILKCRDAKSKEEMDRLVASITPSESAGSMLDEPDIR